MAKLSLPALEVVELPKYDILGELALKAEPKNIGDALVANRAGPVDIARIIGDVMNCSPKDALKLKAASLAADLLGLDRGKEMSSINIIIQDANVNMNNLFNPTR